MLRVLYFDGKEYNLKFYSILTCDAATDSRENCFISLEKFAVSFGQGARSLKLLMDEVVKCVQIWMNSHRVDNFSSGYLSTRWTKHPSVLSSDHDQKRWQR